MPRALSPLPPAHSAVVTPFIIGIGIGIIGIIGTETTLVVVVSLHVTSSRGGGSRDSNTP
jgi:hypothetical protein